MNDQQKTDARDLLERAGVSDAYSIPDDALCYVLDATYDLMDERPAPDASWLQDYFTITGEHMVLTDEGWEPGDSGYADEEIIDEINKPEPETV